MTDKTETGELESRRNQTEKKIFPSKTGIYNILAAHMVPKGIYMHGYIYGEINHRDTC